MLTANQIAQMTRKEKLQMMEAIWADLSKEEGAVESPAWHQQALEETTTRLSAGQEQAVDWNTAKRMLGKRFE